MQTLIEGKYEVLGKIKEGGMGAIYKVRHIHLDEIRVIKVMKPQIESNRDARVRFQQEARFATSLKHPNIAAVLDFAIDEKDNFYMVLEFIEGLNLSEYLQKHGPPPLALGLQIGVQALRALGYLHRKGYVHRDISPDNIMLTKDADGEFLVKLIDLGVAKRTEGETLTQTGMFVGKLQYASPEQLGKLEAGEKIDGRSDIYAFGCVLYRTLTGVLPFQAESLPQYVVAHLTQAPRPFAETDPDNRIPESLRSAVLTALNKNRQDRWPNAEDFAEYLKSCEAELVSESAARHAATSLDLSHPQTPVPRTPTSGVSSLQRKLGDVFPASDDQLTVPAQPRSTASHVLRSRKNVLTLVSAGLAVLCATALLYLALQRRHATETAGTQEATPTKTLLASLPGDVLFSASPWARVISIVNQETKSSITVDGAVTPTRLELPPGKYLATLAWKEQTIQVPFEVAPARTERVHAQMPGFDVQAAVQAVTP